MIWRRYRRVHGWILDHWTVLRRVAIAAFALLVISLLALAIIEIDFAEVLSAMRALPSGALALAAVFTIASYLLYSSFDLLGRWYTGHHLAAWRAMLAGFVAYAFTMSMGTPVGGIGMRMRLYTRQGLSAGTVMRILAVSLMTNWVGYVILTGLVLASGTLRLPWGPGTAVLRLIGMGGVAVGAGYVLASAFARQRRWQWGRHAIELPSARLALVQCVAGITNWILIAAVLYVLFQQRVAFVEVLGILLVSAIAGAAAHVPGGIGVIEYVFVALLSGQLARNEVLAAVLIYRAYYYLAPVLAAAIAWLLAEAALRKEGRVGAGTHGSAGPGDAELRTPPQGPAADAVAPAQRRATRATSRQPGETAR